MVYDQRQKENSQDLRSRLWEFMNNEALSCSMDWGCITPVYVYRMWGGVVAINDIEAAMSDVRKMM